MICFILLPIIFFAGGSTLSAYDCVHPEAKFQAIDLGEVEPCPDPVRAFKPKQDQYAMVLHSEPSINVQGHRCKVSYTKEVSVCHSHFGLNYGSKYTAWQKDLHLSEEDCRKAVQNKQITVAGRTFDIELGVVRRVQFYSRGNLGESLSICNNEDFISEGIPFQSAVEQTRAEILVESIRGTADLNSNSVVLSGGLRATYDNGFVHDNRKGTYFWQVEQVRCKEVQSQVFSGLAEIHIKNYRDKSKEPLNSLLIVDVEQTKQYIGVVLRERIKMCGLDDCFATDVKGLNVCLYKEGFAPQGFAYLDFFDISRADRLTQLGFLHLTSELDHNARFSNLSNAICELDRRTLSTKLQMIAGGNPLALLDHEEFGVGHEIYVQGRVAYVTKCVEVEVTKGHSDNCTQEIPVVYNGTQKFLHPLTFILHDFGSISVCNPDMPVMWWIEPTWVCSTPSHIECLAPTKMKASFGLDDSENDFTRGLGGGAFSEDQINAHRIFVRNQNSREAAMSKITEAMVSTASQGILGVPVSEKNMFTFAWDLLGKISPLMYYMGTGWMLFVCVVSIIGWLRFFIEALYRMYRIYTRDRRIPVNPVLAVIAVFWHAAFEVVMMPINKLHDMAHWWEDVLHEQDPEDPDRNHRLNPRNYARNFRRQQVQNHPLPMIRLEQEGNPPRQDPVPDQRQNRAPPQPPPRRQAPPHQVAVPIEEYNEVPAYPRLF